MKTRIVRIGNSRGVRIPKPLLEEAGLEDEVQLTLGPDGILISPLKAARAGWAEAAELAHERGEAGLLDAFTSTRFDRSSWEWDPHEEGNADESED
ncbi:MAG: AbrB/MazE/SpoVT family DNA-binding domain-containing protein [Gemmatimonadetes bacterium]|nr:AbrB/MazE/SpoVT family DNA-binding domain-containing protein [Gemmatimonadota bacterium]